MHTTTKRKHNKLTVSPFDISKMARICSSTVVKPAHIYQNESSQEKVSFNHAFTEYGSNQASQACEQNQEEKCPKEKLSSVEIEGNSYTIVGLDNILQDQQSRNQNACTFGSQVSDICPINLFDNKENISPKSIPENSGECDDSFCSIEKPAKKISHLPQNVRKRQCKTSNKLMEQKRIEFMNSPICNDSENSLYSTPKSKK